MVDPTSEAKSEVLTLDSDHHLMLRLCDHLRWRIASLVERQGTCVFAPATPENFNPGVDLLANRDSRDDIVGASTEPSEAEQTGRSAIGRRLTHVLRASIFAALIAFPRSALAASPQIWFGPMDPVYRPQSGFGGPPDYMALFRSPGDALLSQIDVFKIFGQFANGGTDAELTQVFAALRRNHVALAMEIGILTPIEHCGGGVEGYVGAGLSNAAARIARLGGDLAYVVADEPIAGADRCHEDLVDAARSAAANVAAVKLIFPQVRVGDIEAVGPSPEAAIRWVEAFQAAAGEPFAFFHADVSWTKSWRLPLEKLAAAMHERKIPFGVTYNGNNAASSDQAWIAQADAHWRAVEAGEQIRPDQVIFQSWAAHPTRLFPNTDPGAFTYLLQDYLRQHQR